LEQENDPNDAQAGAMSFDKNACLRITRGICNGMKR
jgi:hypothetical protein